MPSPSDGLRCGADADPISSWPLTESERPNDHGNTIHTILSRTQRSPNVTQLVLDAPRIAEIRKPGQFVIVRLGPGAERVPLTIADGDPVAGTMTLVIQSVGRSTHDLASLEPGQTIQDVSGPLGRPTALLKRGSA